MNVLVEIASLVTPTIALFAFFGYFWRKHVLPFMVEQMSGLMEQRTTAAIVKKELTMNGGGSVKDLVSQIGPNHEEALGHWKTLEQSDLTTQRRLARIEATLKLPPYDEKP